MLYARMKSEITYNISNWTIVAALVAVAVLFPSSMSAQTLTTLFEPTAASEFIVSGDEADSAVIITPMTMGGSFGFLFEFDSTVSSSAYPDTITLLMDGSIRLKDCSDAWMSYSTWDDLPDDDTWVAGNVRVYAKSENKWDWYQKYGDLGDESGSVRWLFLKWVIAVRTNDELPGSFFIKDIVVEGNCY